MVLKRDDVIFNRIRYIISTKNGIADIHSSYRAKIKVDSSDSLPTGKLLALHIDIIYIKSVLNKDNNYFYKAFF